MNKIKLFLMILVILSIVGAISYFYYPEVKLSANDSTLFTEPVVARSFDVEIRTLGELEAAESISINSMIRGDWGKIISLIPDGSSVNKGDILVKFDPTPFEEHIEEINQKIKDEENKLEGLQQTLEWETYQASHENSIGQIEIETAHLEINKIMYGDGPIEEARLKNLMNKALVKYDEIKGYSTDLIELEAENFLNPIELKQAQKKLLEEEEAYLSAKMQYDTFVNHVYPMQIKKAESALKKAESKAEEIIKSGRFKVARAQVQYVQSAKSLNDLKILLKNAQDHLMQSEISAPSSGMVVLKEDFRNGQRRKPRIGDVLLKNQCILDLPDLDHMIVKTKVREVDLYKVQYGTKANVEVDAYPHLSFTGKITSIGVLAVSDMARSGEEKYFDVTIAMDSKDHRLRPGMTARVLMSADRVENELAVPVQAIFEFDNLHYCFVKMGELCTLKPVVVGINNDHWIEIKNGLEEYEEVVLNMPPVTKVTNAYLITGKK